MEKFCVFCGKKPEDKTKEHIIPRWLIEYTGKPNRNINVGFDMKNKKMRTFAFDKLTFPACDACNRKYSKLEEDTKKVLINILEKDELYYEEITTLLDWLDKVRIGLWLLFYSLNDNPMDIGPNFHIEDRIGKYDRMLIIYKTKYNIEKGINFIGTDTDVFQMTPCCYTLRINNYYFFNVSKEFLLSRRIGFPYPIESEYISENSDEVLIDMKDGQERKMLPLIRKNHFMQGIEIYQPMFEASRKDLFELHNNDYVRENCLSLEKGVGKPFLYNRNNNKLEEKLKINFCEAVSNVDSLYNQVSVQTFKYQNEILKMKHASYKNISNETKLLWKQKRKAALIYNEFLIELSKKGNDLDYEQFKKKYIK